MLTTPGMPGPLPDLARTWPGPGPGLARATPQQTIKVAHANYFDPAHMLTRRHPLYVNPKRCKSNFPPIQLSGAKVAKLDAFKAELQ
jgi:hypothetical protein